MNKFSHVDVDGKATMVDVGDKPAQKRLARARGKIFLLADTIRLIQENQIKKGDVLTVAQIAGIQAAKQTVNLIPLCHSILLSKVDLQFSFDHDGIIAESLAKCVGKTGVEMEALTAVSVSLLTIYDMCKAIDKQMKIGDILLIEKVKEDV